MRRRFVPSAIVFALVALCGACSSASPADERVPVARPVLVAGPETIASGMPFELTLRFEVAPDAPPLHEDYLVFVHVLDPHGELLGASDHAPATPTREWRPGDTIEYTRTLFAPVTGYTGPTTLIAGLYSPVTGERLPVAGTEIGPAAVSLARLEMRERVDPYAVTFREGWHPPEAPAGSGLEWRWSMKSGVLSFPRPSHDVVLVLQLDQPADVFRVWQHVDVMLGDTALDGFDLEPGRVELRRIPIPAADLPPTDDVELEVLADKTYVPADHARLGSPDTRQLGVRLLRVYVESAS